MRRVFRNIPRPLSLRIRLRTLILLVAVVAALMGGARLLRSLLADEETNAWVGWNEGELVGRLGQPFLDGHTEDFDSFNNPRRLNPPPPIEPRRLLWFRTRCGELGVWLRPVDHRWVCYHSIWHRDGGVDY